ncbi:hypothetical protein P7K49_032610 [Saguinus oedipus]|uniref:Uncharacterized protein n=1 Tax=Saguinus oedipus TaxID=9490 RepID=A0ABQ9TYQ4_SAGOE|nr:hypothetical protein P7K49_032610 [Saguinus oedipus]
MPYKVHSPGQGHQVGDPGVTSPPGLMGWPESWQMAGIFLRQLTVNRVSGLNGKASIHQDDKAHTVCRLPPFGQISHLCLSPPPGEPPRAEAGLGAGYVVLTVVAIFVLVVGAATFLIVRYRRTSGRYNFKIQSDDFSYRVFYE